MIIAIFDVPTFFTEAKCFNREIGVGGSKMIFVEFMVL